MCYREAKSDEVARYRESVNKLSNTQNIVVGGQERGASGPLVLAHWAGEKLMILRSTPIVIATNNFSEKEEHSRLYSDLLLYRPWRGRSEREEFGLASQSVSECLERYNSEKTAIAEVKEGLRRMLMDQM